MDSEKDLLKQDLSKQETPSDITKFIEDAELLGHEDIAEIGRKKLQETLEKTNTIGKTSESQVSQVESVGGTQEEILEKTKDVDRKIEEVKAEMTKQIEEVNNEPTVDKEEVASSPEQNEKTKIEVEIRELEANLNDEHSKITFLPEYISKYNRRSELVEKAKNEVPEELKSKSIQYNPITEAWVLVSDTDKLKELLKEQNYRVKALEYENKGSQEERINDPEYKRLNSEIQKFVGDYTSIHDLRNSPNDFENVYVKFNDAGGSFGLEERTTLSNALNKSIEFNKNAAVEMAEKLDEHKKKISEYELKLIELKNKEESLETNKVDTKS